MTDEEPETAVSASLQKIKSIKNQQKHFFSFFISLNLKLVTHLLIISTVKKHTLSKALKSAVNCSVLVFRRIGAGVHFSRAVL